MPVTLSELEQHLWGAANILRGSIDSGEYKSYIFGLLFFKRLSDVWEEEYEQKLSEYGDEELAADAEEHRFDVPQAHCWVEVRKHTTNIGEYLNAAFQAIEDANMKLRGIFQSVDFNNKDRFSDAMLERLLQHFERYDLRNSNVDSDMLGNAYEYLIKQFADDGGKKGGEFYTPKEVVRLMVRCLEIDEGMSVYDPTCGSGGMLLEAYRAVEQSGKNARSLSLYGQERNLNTWAICQMNLFLHDIDDADVRRGDTLREPKHTVGEGRGAIRSFDRVIANPPFSLKEWGHSAWSNGDPYGRDTYGTPPKAYGDLAFVQHMLASLNETGKLAVVVPHGVLFRAGAEGAIRKAFIEHDLVEGVIGLAPNLFYGAGIPAAILFLRKKKPHHMKGRVMIVNGAEQFEEGRAQNYLRDTHIDELSAAYLVGEDVERLARVVEAPEIEANDFSLNLPLYLNLEADAEDIDVDIEQEKIVEAWALRENAETRQKHLMQGYDFSHSDVDEVNVFQLSDISDFITKGATPTTYGFEWQQQGVPFLRSECVSDNGFTESGLAHICEDAHEAMSRSKLEPGDLLITITGNVGRVAVLPANIPRANINQHIARVRITSNEVLPEYVYYFLNSPVQRHHYQAIVTGQAYPQLSLKQIRETRIAVPSLQRQRLIVSLLSQVDDALKAEAEVAWLQQRLRSGIQNKLVGLLQGVG